MRREIERTLQHAQFLARHLHGGISPVVVAILIELDVPTNRDGFEYIKRAIMKVKEDPTQGLMKEVYSFIANSNCDDDIKKIDQAIGSAINQAWKRRDEDIWYYFFPIDKYGKIVKPSNSEFIYMIARFLELWEGCCEEVRHEKEKR